MSDDNIELPVSDTPYVNIDKIKMTAGLQMATIQDKMYQLTKAYETRVEINRIKLMQMVRDLKRAAAAVKQNTGTRATVEAELENCQAELSRTEQELESVSAEAAITKTRLANLESVAANADFVSAVAEAEANVKKTYADLAATAASRQQRDLSKEKDSQGELKDRVKTAEKEISTLEDQVSVLQDEASTLEGQVSSLQGESTQLRAREAELMAAVTHQAAAQQQMVGGTTAVQQHQADVQQQTASSQAVVQQQMEGGAAQDAGTLLGRENAAGQYASAVEPAAGQPSAATVAQPPAGQASASPAAGPVSVTQLAAASASQSAADQDSAVPIANPALATGPAAEPASQNPAGQGSAGQGSAGQDGAGQGGAVPLANSTPVTELASSSVPQNAPGQNNASAVVDPAAGQASAAAPAFAAQPGASPVAAPSPRTESASTQQQPAREERPQPHGSQPGTPTQRKDGPATASPAALHEPQRQPQPQPQPQSQSRKNTPREGTPAGSQPRAPTQQPVFTDQIQTGWSPDKEPTPQQLEEDVAQMRLALSGSVADPGVLADAAAAAAETALYPAGRTLTIGTAMAEAQAAQQTGQVLAGQPPEARAEAGRPLAAPGGATAAVESASERPAPPPRHAPVHPAAQSELAQFEHGVRLAANVMPPGSVAHPPGGAEREAGHNAAEPAALMSRHDVVVSSSTAVYTDLRQDPHCQEDEVAFLRKEVKRLQDLIHGGQDHRRYRPSASPVCEPRLRSRESRADHIASEIASSASPSGPWELGDEGQPRMVRQIFHGFPRLWTRKTVCVQRLNSLFLDSCTRP